MYTETQISLESKTREIKAIATKKLLTPNTETVPANEMKTIKTDAELVAKFLAEYLEFLPKVLRGEVEKAIITKGSMETINLPAIGRYNNDGNPYQETENGGKQLNNPTLKQLEKILYSLGMVSMRGEIVTCSNIDDSIFVKSRSEWIGKNGDFNNIPQITSITKLPIMLGCNSKKNSNQNFITSFKSNEIVRLEDIKSPFDELSQYYHSHTCHIQQFEKDGKTIIFVTLGDYGEKKDDQKAITRDNIYENCFTLAYVIKDVEIKVENNKKLIPAFNNRIGEVTLFLVNDNSNNQEDTSTQQKLDREFRLLPDLKSISKDSPYYKIKTKGDTMSVVINPDARKNYYGQLLARKTEIEDLLNEDQERITKLYKNITDYEHRLENLELGSELWNLTTEYIDEEREKLTTYIQITKNRITRILESNPEKQNKLEIKLSDITLELERLTAGKLEKISHFSPNIKAIQDYRQKITDEHITPISISKNFLNKFNISSTLAAGALGFAHGYIDTNLTQNNLTKRPVEETRLVQASAGAITEVGLVGGCLLGISAFSAIKKRTKEKQQIEDEVKRISGLNVPKIRP